MKTKELKKQIEWDQYYNSEFNWDNENFYRNNQLSKDFIREFKDKINWKYLCIFQKLSEKFIEENINLIDWKSISGHQKLSEKFIRKYKDKIDFFFIGYNRHLSNRMKYKFEKELQAIGFAEVVS